MVDADFPGWGLRLGFPGDPGDVADPALEELSAIPAPEDGFQPGLFGQGSAQGKVLDLAEVMAEEVVEFGEGEVVDVGGIAFQAATAHDAPAAMEVVIEGDAAKKNAVGLAEDAVDFPDGDGRVGQVFHDLGHDDHGEGSVAEIDGGGDVHFTAGDAEAIGVVDGVAVEIDAAPFAVVEETAGEDAAAATEIDGEGGGFRAEFGEFLLKEADFFFVLEILDDAVLVMLLVVSLDEFFPPVRAFEEEWGEEVGGAVIRAFVHELGMVRQKGGSVNLRR